MWIDAFRNLRVINFLVSPYRQKDVNPDGSKEKPRYHILLQGEGGHLGKFRELKDLVKKWFLRAKA